MSCMSIIVLFYPNKIQYLISNLYLVIVTDPRKKLSVMLYFFLIYGFNLSSIDYVRCSYLWYCILCIICINNEKKIDNY